MSPIAAFFRVLILDSNEDDFGASMRDLDDSPAARAIQLIVGYCRILLNDEDVQVEDENLAAINEDSRDLIASVSHLGAFIC